MKIVYVSNFMNHHQLPIAQRLYEKYGDDYRFVALSGLPKERQKFGYEDMNHSFPFVVCAYDSPELQEYANRITVDCDILLAGSCPDSYIKRRTDAGKIVIKTSERFFKSESSLKEKFHNFLSALKHLAPFQGKKLYFLCASAYTSVDINRFTRFTGKAYKWGYFPETKKYESIENIINSKKKNSILWAGRLLDWKHPDAAIRTAKKLKENGYKFELNIIGTGAMEQELKNMISDYDLENDVHILGSMKPEQVREYMEQSQIYLFTSDRNEGWGAVLNESMNSACAVVANREIGSVPYLLNNEKNGLIYDSEEELYLCVKKLMNDSLLQRELGKAAYRTIADCWSPEIAVERLVQFICEICKSGSCTLFENGPCSKDEKRR